MSEIIQKLPPKALDLFTRWKSRRERYRNNVLERYMNLRQQTLEDDLKRYMYPVTQEYIEHSLERLRV
jgi:hypothetical protein